MGQQLEGLDKVGQIAADGQAGKIRGFTARSDAVYPGSLSLIDRAAPSSLSTLTVRRIVLTETPYRRDIFS